MTEMAPAESFRGFISERLSAAAEEIFGAFKRAMMEYEAEIDRQRRLMDVGRKPSVQLYRQEVPQEEEAPSNQERSSSPDQPGPTVWKSHTDLPRTELSQRQLVCKEEEATSEQHLSHHERNQDDPEPLRIKEEPGRLCTIQEGEQLELKQETEIFESDLTCEESNHMEPQMNGYHMLLAHNAHVTENQIPESSYHGKTKPEKRLQKSSGHSPESVGDLLSPDKATMSFECDTCGEVFRGHSELQTHLLVHTDKSIHTCENSGIIFSSKSSLKTHTQIHTSEKPYSCKICRKHFNSSHVLKHHMRDHTGKPYSESTKSEQFSQKIDERSHFQIQAEEKLLSFKSCGQVLSDDSILKSQVKTETPVKPHSCSICGQRFSDMSDLNEHTQSHTDDKPFACEACGKSFQFKGHLTNHMTTHTREKHVSCSTCGKVFSNRTILNSHVEIHTGEKPFTCKTCGKSFRLKGHLTNHMTTHTREKHVSCSTCGKVFSNRTILNSHVNIHTGEKPFTCKTCGKSFRLKSDLASHMRRHTGERPCSCSFCGKRFYDKSDLNKHIKIHTGEKPFSCKICGKSFKRSFVLTVHMRTHTGEMPYLCSTCGMGFRRRTDLSRHTNQFHTGETAFLLN